MFFAGEKWEKGNKKVRDKSMHSNRQAPSRDIENEYSLEQGHRHVMSAGIFKYKGAYVQAREGILKLS